MTALPQIFAPQPTPHSPLSRSFVSDAPQPAVTDRVQGESGRDTQGRSDKQSNDRDFGQAMSEQEKTPARQDSDPVKTTTAKKTARSSHSSQELNEVPREQTSDDLFVDLYSNPATTSQTETPSEVTATVSTESDKPQLVESDAIEAPLPQAGITLERPINDETDGKELAESKTQTPPSDFPVSDLPAEGDLEKQPVLTRVAEAPTETDGTLNFESEVRQPSAEQTLIQPSDREADIPPLADTKIVAVNSDDTITQPKSNSQTAAQTDETLATTDKPKGEASPKAESQPQTLTLTQPSSKSEGPTQTSVEPQNAIQSRDTDTLLRSDRAYAAPSTADIIPDADRLLPTASKTVPLASLADSVSLPGATPSLPASTPLTPISGLSERLAATILQTTQANPTVTLDKLPQAVVTVALSNRSATIQIDPPELGRIQLDYQFDSQGRTVVTLTPESEAARSALVDRMATITAALEQGSSSGVEVKLGNAQDFGTAFSDASDGDAGDGEAASTSSSDVSEAVKNASEDNLPLMGHHIAEDGTSRLHMRV